MVKVDASYIKILENKLRKINNTIYQNPKKKAGDLGEAFVKDGIKYFLWDKGFKVGKTGYKTFTLYGFNRITKKFIGGVDFKLKINYNTKYDFYIEAKNWNSHYKITNEMFNEGILDRFTKNANQPGWIWVVTMNKKNIHKIKTKCIQYNIYILPLEDYIDTKQINATSLTKMMDMFLDDFSILFYKKISRKPHSYKYKSTSITDKIKEDIRLGKPYDYLADRYGKSKNNIQKIASQMKSKGEDLFDRRSDDWDIIQYRTDYA